MALRRSSTVLPSRSHVVLGCGLKLNQLSQSLTKGKYHVNIHRPHSILSLRHRYLGSVAYSVTLSGESQMQLEQTNLNWQTQARGTNDTEYQIYLYHANDGKGGYITNNGKPLKSYDEWLNS
jgi:hypothetical protein